ncbi:hypothetical protein H6F67_26725 [Microcoleus sp. FACHB-1515]|uniref:hypothetical protein n=1 Tax=Cyanophyceae TaxID=3028117 RepID=UPI001688BB1E|nr:hypothetical protein [Microcoleus sp. FACHB-1515]MBD2093439.1 hypothetical protein [Microcoleus sp. FACHB-1515]
MAKITLEIPDDLVERLGENPADWLRDRLPQLLEFEPQQPILPAHIYRYILDFIASNPTAKQIAEFRPSASMQERLRSLLDRAQAGDLTSSEQAELDEYERIEHLVILLKAGNLKALTSQP